ALDDGLLVDGVPLEVRTEHAEELLGRQLLRMEGVPLAELAGIDVLVRRRDQEQTRGRTDTADLREERFLIGQVLDQLVRDDDVEGGVAKRQPRRIGEHERTERMGAADARVADRVTVAIERDDLAGERGQDLGAVTEPTAELEDATAAQE